MKTSSKPIPDHLSPTGLPFWQDRMGVAHLNFAWAARHYGAMDDSALRFVIEDCREAIKANPENKKNGYYMDTIHVAGGILARRETEA